MAGPTLTIDFKGLCAFVARKTAAQTIEYLQVVMMDTDQAAPKEHLCRHDPVVVFRLREDFLNAGSKTVHHSFSSVTGEDLGFWHAHGKLLKLEGVDDQTKDPLALAPSYEEVLSIAKLNEGDAGVEKANVAKPSQNGVGALLKIDHGLVSALTWTDVRWAPAPKNTIPAPQDYQYIRQVVRWQISALKLPNERGLRLAAGPKQWIEFQRGAHIVISNLCPFTAGSITEAPDVLAYYALCKKPIPELKRKILYLEGKKGLGLGTPVRPGADACPPVTGTFVS